MLDIYRICLWSTFAGLCGCASTAWGNGAEMVSSFVRAMQGDDELNPLTMEVADYDIVAESDVVSQVIETYTRIVFANYSDTTQMVIELDKAIDAFLENPSEEGLNKAREAWKYARKFYAQTEGFRFYNGPIDGLEGPEGLLNAWPLDESYIDYVTDFPNAGIINQPEVYPEITAELLTKLNEKEGETNITTGFHSIEFLLWGQDPYTDSAGRRPVSDFLEHPHADRRRAYLEIISDMQVANMQYLVDQWQPGEDNYRAEFLALPVKEALSRMFTGIGVFLAGELSGERMLVALATRDQEDEHSCFSDNTHQDIIEGIRGVRNVFLGYYRRPDGTFIAGPGLVHLMKEQEPRFVYDPEGLADRMAAQLNVAMDLAEAMPRPFDQAILGSDRESPREDVLKTVGMMQRAIRTMIVCAKRMGIDLAI